MANFPGVDTKADPNTVEPRGKFKTTLGNIIKRIPEIISREQNIRNERREARQLFIEYSKVKETALLDLDKYSDVPYSRNIGIVIKTFDGTLITGRIEGQRAIDCNVVVVVGKDQNMMAHISPQTMNDYFYEGEWRRKPSNFLVDKMLLEKLQLVGEVDRVVIISGHDNLGAMLQKWFDGSIKDRPWDWGGDSTMIKTPNIPADKISRYEMGNSSKEVLYESNSNIIWVCENGNKVTKIPLNK
ncbi:MAG: hypothetical protein WCK31_04170 [bacterium]